MMSTQSNREVKMNRRVFLNVATRLRLAKSGATAKNSQPRQSHSVVNVTALDVAKYAGLTATERHVLRSTLEIMLQRERRRCKARAGSYDPGRHIALYVAVKALAGAQTKSPGAKHRGS
jgi:hypothetical protein